MTYVAKQPTLFRRNGQVHIDYYVQKFDLWYIGYFNIQGLDVKFMLVIYASSLWVNLAW